MMKSFRDRGLFKETSGQKLHYSLRSKKILKTILKIFKILKWELTVTHNRSSISQVQSSTTLLQLWKKQF